MWAQHNLPGFVLFSWFLSFLGSSGKMISTLWLSSQGWAPAVKKSTCFPGNLMLQDPHPCQTRNGKCISDEVVHWRSFWASAWVSAHTHARFLISPTNRAMGTRWLCQGFPCANPSAFYSPQTSLVKTGEQSSSDGHSSTSTEIHKKKFVIFTHFHVCHHQLLLHLKYTL